MRAHDKTGIESTSKADLELVATGKIEYARSSLQNKKVVLTEERGVKVPCARG